MSVGPLYLSYQTDLAKEAFMHDPAQEAVVKHLDRLYLALVDQSQKAPPSFLQKILQSFGASGSGASGSGHSVKGLYIWGGVGTGKTFLVDKFYALLPLNNKTRIHFHRFMRRVHEELTELQGEKDPLSIIGKAWGKRYSLICLDEFFVSDITDAMILSGLLKSMFDEGLVLVATSNVAPKDLYKDGLQRARFLPAIDLIQTNLQDVTLNTKNDFRLRSLEQAEIYHSPLDGLAHSQMQDYFSKLAPDKWVESGMIELDGRSVASIYVSDDIVWFDFGVLCGGPRSQRDYIELAMVYHAILLSDVPIMRAEDEDKARRFINFIDEVYDRNVKLIISAEVPIECLYQGENLAFEFERTQSRLTEMQSHAYLAKPHRP